MFSRFDTTPERDRQTDGRTDIFAISNEYGASVLLCWRDKNSFSVILFNKQTNRRDHKQYVTSPGLQMSSWPGTVIPRWRTSSSSRVGVSKASAFRFVLWTVCSPYQTLNLRRPSFSSRRCTDLEQSSAAYHICSVTRNYCCRVRKVTLSFMDTLIALTVTYLLTHRLSRGRGNYYRFEYFYPISSLLAYNQVITQLKSTCYCRP